MESDKKIGKTKITENYILKTNYGPVLTDETGDWWIGGSLRRVGIALFKDRKLANKIAARIKREDKDIKEVQRYRVYLVS